MAMRLVLAMGVWVCDWLYDWVVFGHAVEPPHYCGLVVALGLTMAVGCDWVPLPLRLTTTWQCEWALFIALVCMQIPLCSSRGNTA